MPERMRAAVVMRYGPPTVVMVREVDRPEPGAGEVLVRVVAAAVTSADARIWSATFPPGFALPARLGLGLRGPRRAVLGASLSGEIVGLGTGVEGFTRGDRVCGMTGTSLGAHAEYAGVPAARLVRVPEGVTHDEALGLLFGGTTARYFLERATKVRGPVGAGTRLLINGASGAVGTSAVQLAAGAGAEVTGVTRAENAALVERLGAHDTVDHQREDLLTSGRRFDVVLDAVGNLDIPGANPLLGSDGLLLLTTPSLLRTIVPPRNARRTSRRCSAWSRWTRLRSSTRWSVHSTNSRPRLGGWTAAARLGTSSCDPDGDDRPSVESAADATTDSVPA